ncbi:MAG: hypothetical protein FWE61_08350 [Micrococcales bacterium]|nr:hypothetical protein [Micrococcales bacterium]
MALRWSFRGRSLRRRTVAVVGACGVGVLAALATILSGWVGGATLAVATVLGVALVACATVVVVDDLVRTLRARVGVLRNDVEALLDVLPEVNTTMELSGGHRPRVLLVTSNGAGMGHIVRCLAVGTALVDHASYAVLTLSTAHETVRQAGFPVTYFPSVDAKDWGSATWNRAFGAYLAAVLVRNDIDLVVFDGTFVYRGITASCRDAGVPLVWLRRGLWKDGSRRTQFDAPLAVADHVLVPAELGEPDQQDEPWLTQVPAITLASREGLLPRAQACRELGLEPTGRYVLVQVGHTTFDGQTSGVQAVVEAVHDCLPGMTPVVLVSPALSDAVLPVGAQCVVGRFPLAPFLSAFEVAVCAAGYNSVYE